MKVEGGYGLVFMRDDQLAEKFIIREKCLLPVHIYFTVCLAFLRKSVAFLLNPITLLKT